MSATSHKQAPRRPLMPYETRADPRREPGTISGQHHTSYLPQAQATTPGVFSGNKFIGSGYQGRPSDFRVSPPPAALPGLRPAPALSASSGGGLFSTSGVTRDMSSLSITAPDSSHRLPVPAYQQPDQQSQQSDPHPYLAPPQRTYGDDITQEELDRSRGIGPQLGSMQFKPQQQAASSSARGQGFARQDQPSSAFMTAGGRSYEPDQVMRPPEQASREPRNRGKQNQPPPTQMLPGVDGMLSGKPPGWGNPPPGRPVPRMYASQQGTFTGHDSASRHGSMASVPPVTANPQPPYQDPRDVAWTGRGSGDFRVPASSQERHRYGLEADQELRRLPAHGYGAPAVLDDPRGEDEAEFQSGFRGHPGRGRERSGRGAPSRS